MPNMTIKPKFDLAAHLAKPPTPKEVQNADRLRKQRAEIQDRYKKHYPLLLEKSQEET